METHASFLGGPLLDKLTRRRVQKLNNSLEKFQPVMDAMKTKVTWAQSGLHFHSTAMFLDDRASNQQLREWFWNLVSKPISRLFSGSGIMTETFFGKWGGEVEHPT